MSDFTPTPPQHGEYPERDCPMCGETVKVLAYHLPDCPEAEHEPHD